MNGHPEFLELIAMSIDFDLTDEEFGRLSTHLARCPECRRAAEELRGDATAIAASPAPRLAPARSEQILRAALRTPRPQPRWGMLAVAAMLTTLGGGILFAGYQLINDDDATPSEPPPSLVAEASAPPSPTPAEDTAEPGAPDGGDPPAVDVPEPTPEPPEVGEIDFEFPRPYTSDISSVRVAPLADGHVWVSFQARPGTVLALLDETGAGRPLVIPGAEDCVPLSVADGSVRLVCSDGSEPEDCIDVCTSGDVVHAYSADVQEMPGYPVLLPAAVPGSFDRYGARVVETDVVVGFTTTSDFGENEQPPPEESRLLTVHSDGSVDFGEPQEGPERCCTVSPEGIGFGKSVESHDDGTQTTSIYALDPSNLLDGWVDSIPGTASGPAFGPDGDVYFSSWVDEGSQIVRFHDASPASIIDLSDSITWDPAIDGPRQPLVDERGRTSVVANGRILSFDAAGAPVPGFPYEPETGLVQRGDDCGPQETGCQPWIDPPRVASRGLIYSLEEAPSGKGERITVVNPDGGIRSGWPKTLQREGAAWESVTLGENGVAYAVAVEPEPGNESSISILAFAPNGTRQWIRTIVEP